MSYYNYHARVKKFILENKDNIKVKIVDKYNNISPCMLIYNSNKSYPIREYKWDIYINLFEKLNIDIDIKVRNENEISYK